MKLFLKKIKLLCLATLIVACGVEPRGGERAITDTRHALGMILVEKDGEERLRMVVCEVKEGLQLDAHALVDETICVDAFVKEDGNPYYFKKLKHDKLNRETGIAGYAKLAAVVVIPIVIGTVLGSKRVTKWLLKKSKLVITPDYKFIRDRGMLNKAEDLRPIAKGKKAMKDFLERPRSTLEIGLGGGVIISLVGAHHGHRYIWGAGERQTVNNWDDIFRLHGDFADAKDVSENPQAIKNILATLAVRLGVRVNPVINFTQPQE